jgi:hypothetical protein
LDFDVMDVPFHEKGARYRSGLPRLAAMLRGEDLGDLAGDRALQACGGRPVTVVGTAMSEPAVRRAAAAGVGVVYDGASAPARLGELSDAYDSAGGPGPKVLIRRVWLGDPPTEAFDRQVDVYRSYTPAAAQQHWRDNGFLCRDRAEGLVEDLTGARSAAGADVLNLRIHVDGVSPGQAREQISRLGAEVLPLLRQSGLVS